MLNIHYAKLRGGKIKTAQLRGKLSAVLLNAQKRILKRLDEYVATWDHKPFFESKKGVKYASGDISVGISTDDQIFWWLEEGTDVRYRVMSSNPLYQPKTSPGRINSKSGAGYPDYFDPMGRLGIEPREIRKTITALEEFQFRNDVMTVIANVDFIGGEETFLG